MPRALGRLIENEDSEKVSFENAKKEPRKIDLPEDYNKEIGNLRSIASAPVKGAVKELREQGGKIFGDFTKAFGIDTSSLKDSGLVSSQSDFDKTLNEYLPTKDRFLEAGLERGGRYAPYAALGGAAAIPRAVAAGVVGEGVKEIGGGPGLQLAGEVLTQGLPGLAKKITGKSSQQQELINFARKMGLKEEEIAPLIQSTKKASWLGKFAKKHGKPQERIQQSKKAATGIYQTLANSPIAASPLSQQATTDLLNKMTKVLYQMPAQQRDLILRDFLDLQKNGFTGSGLINFYQDINFQYGRGNRHLGGLLDPVKDAISSISPELSKEFSLTNELFKNHLQLAKRMKPGLFEDLWRIGKWGRIATGIATLNPAILIETVGESAGRRLFAEMLTNPRFQNISKQMVDALNKGRYAVVRQLADKVLEESKDETDEQK